jgi:5-methylcytosine-specific restriction enzyme subunit McrC
MIFLFEQFGYKNTGYLDTIANELCSKIPCEPIVRTIKRHRQDDAICFYIRYDETKKKHHFETSYFIGVDWIVENQRSIYVQPKQNKEDIEVDYINMLLEALQEPENFNHLQGLCEIDFNKPYINITQKQDLLSPFLIAQFLQLLRQIVRKGLKKSYYTISENLNAKIKGKVLVGKDIKKNKVKGNLIRTICQFQEFGINCDENKILKKAYSFSRRVIQQYGKGMDTKSLQHIIDYIHPAFEAVSEDIEVSKIKLFKPNPLFKEYDQALKLAQLILKRFSYNITLTEQEQIATPPFWIDMSKLFELYVYKKLRAVFSNKEVQYHLKAQYQELDFVIRSKDDKYIFVVDTKYKPRYENHKISIEDIRQVSGYARIKKVYDELGIADYDRNIKCLIIYSHQNGVKSFEETSFTTKEKYTDEKSMIEEKGYVNFFKLGIKLPELEHSKG